MNDFGVNIKGYVGVVKIGIYHLPKKATVEDRSFNIFSGTGCDPIPGTLRSIRGHWVSDDMPDSISSYDFEYVLDPEGKRIDRTPEEVSDVQPVKLASECATAPALVRRKKGR
jgi:hypothetical protein